MAVGGMTGYNEDYHDSTWPGHDGSATEKLIAAALPSVQEVQRRITAEWNAEKEAFEAIKESLVSFGRGTAEDMTNACLSEAFNRKI